ncbi:serine hydroxymethyltransferase [Patescibacteria group bacterium]|nr:serine hydroxymethyltransferase [Patescibacteria group bacterium]
MQYLQKNDRQIYNLIQKEEKRQYSEVRLIPSENYTSKAVMEASGSVLTNKYSEGYAGKRYYQGQVYIDEIEILAKTRAEELFKVSHANVQPYSGSPANLACYMALLEPGDKIMGMTLTSGGHLTHGASVSAIGKLFEIVPYTVSEKTGLLDFDELEKIAIKEKPKLIIAGYTAYPRKVSFSKFKAIAKKVGAYLHADIAHISGLIVSGEHPSPSPHADTIMTTTHKSLRGPRGAMIMCNSKLAQDIDRAVFPGLQGGPHDNTTAAIAVALKEALGSDFRKYGKQVVRNAQALAEGLQEIGLKLSTGGTDTHLILADVTPLGLIGKQAAVALEKAGLIVNANTIPFDKRSPFSPSGIRLGTPAITTLGMKEKEMKEIVKFIKEVFDHVDNDRKLKQVRKEVEEFMASYR